MSICFGTLHTIASFTALVLVRRCRLSVCWELDAMTSAIAVSLRPGRYKLVLYRSVAGIAACARRNYKPAIESRTEWTSTTSVVGTSEMPRAVMTLAFIGWHRIQKRHNRDNAISDQRALAKRQQQKKTQKYRAKAMEKPSQIWANTGATEDMRDLTHPSPRVGSHKQQCENTTHSVGPAQRLQRPKSAEEGHRGAEGHWKQAPECRKAKPTTEPSI